VRRTGSARRAGGGDGVRTATSWADGGRYERFMGRWSALVAPELLAWLGAPAGLAWLDVGCGTGALSAAVAATARPAALAGVDPSGGFLGAARRRPGAGALRVARADALRLPFADASFDRVVSGLVLNFVPDAGRAVAQMARVLRPGGEVGVYVWDYADGMQMLRRFWDAAAAVDPQVAALDQAERFPVCRPQALQALAEGAGLHAVATTALVVPTVFADLDDYWSPFLGGQGPAPGYVATLDDAHRERLRAELVRRLPAEPDGSVRLHARAWAVRGRRG
jgi:SAM-dependent methyltransferase